MSEHREPDAKEQLDDVPEQCWCHQEPAASSEKLRPCSVGAGTGASRVPETTLADTPHQSVPQADREGDVHETLAVRGRARMDCLQAGADARLRIATTGQRSTEWWMRQRNGSNDVIVT